MAEVKEVTFHGGKTWPDLFPEILMEIISYLSLEDRFCVSRVCKSWREVIEKMSMIWQMLDLKIVPKSREDREKELNQDIDPNEFIEFICKHSHHISKLSLTVSQINQDCTRDALRVLRQLSVTNARRLSCIKLIFSNENPLFYSGKEFLTVLNQLFSCPPDENCNFHEHFTEVDLSRFPVCLEDKLIYTLIDHHGAYLSVIKLQNYSLVCNISKNCIHRLAAKCKQLKSLSTHMSSVDGETLKIFSHCERKPVEFLSFFCQREDKYTSDIDSEDWVSLCQSCPKLRVKFYFDHTCPIFRVEEILKPMIPISVLKLRLLATVTDLIYFITQSYSKTLEIFDVTTTSSAELDAAILHLAMNCTNLKELHVWCRLSKSVVDQILSFHSFYKQTLAYNIDCEN